MAKMNLTGKYHVTSVWTADFMRGMLALRSDVKDYIFENTRQGDIQSIINAFDQFGRTQYWLMNIGDRKGDILEQTVQNRKPKTVLELGTFLGYGALRIISKLEDDAVFISIEADVLSAAIARSILEYAGVHNRVKIVEGDTKDVIPLLKKTFNVDSFDLVFIDHYKDHYVRDLKLLEDDELVKSGSVIVADNAITPGIPDYLKYIRNNPNYTTTLHEATVEYRDDLPDGIEISVRK